MRASIEDFARRVFDAQEVAGGHLVAPVDGLVGWAGFPFEGDLRVKTVIPLTEVEQARFGQDPAGCFCAPAGATDMQWPVRWRPAPPGPGGGVRRHHGGRARPAGPDIRRGPRR